jgi:hypothetical protein
VAQNRSIDAPDLYMQHNMSKCDDLSAQSFNNLKRRIDAEVNVSMDPKRVKQEMDCINKSELGNCFQPDPLLF